MMNNQNRNEIKAKRAVSIVTGLLLAFVVGSTPLFAADDDDEYWNGEIALGGMRTSGNTQVQTLNTAAKATHNGPIWRLEGTTSGLYSSDRGTRTAERYDATLMAGYALSERAYAFVWTGAEKELFSGYQYRLTESVGLGYLLIKTKAHLLNINASVGGRHSKLTLNKTLENEVIGRGEANYDWTISPTSLFTQNVVVEGGKQNTVSKLTSSLTLQIYGSLAAKLSFYGKYTSKVPSVFVRKLDTASSVNLLYSF